MAMGTIHFLLSSFEKPIFAFCIHFLMSCLQFQRESSLERQKSAINPPQKPIKIGPLVRTPGPSGGQFLKSCKESAEFQLCSPHFDSSQPFFNPFFTHECQKNVASQPPWAQTQGWLFNCAKNNHQKMMKMQMPNATEMGEKTSEGNEVYA